MKKRLLFVVSTALVIFFAFGLFISRAESAKKCKVFHVKVEGVVDLGLAPFIERVLADAERTRACGVVLEMNTLGGRVDAALKIRDALTSSKVKTVAFVNSRAISAGALIALSCKKIALAEGSTIGAATPVQIGAGGGAAPVSEKMISYFRSEFKATAEKMGRPERIAEAMVDPDVEIKGLTEKGKLLTLTTDEAIKYKIGDYKAGTFDEVLKKEGWKGADVTTLSPNWAERFVRLITHPMVASLLLTLGILGMIMEFKTVGWGVAGTIGVVCIGLFFFGHLLVHLAGWEEMLLFIAGLVMLVVEVFVTPGFGVLGTLGIAACLVSLVLSMVGSPLEFHIDELKISVLRLVVAMSLGMGGAILLAVFFPQTRYGRRLFLDEELSSEKGVVASSNLEEFVGKRGVALTVLRPSGTALVAGKRLSVVTRGEFIDRGATVEVINVEGSRIVVREFEETTTV